MPDLPEDHGAFAFLEAKPKPKKGTLTDVVFSRSRRGQHLHAHGFSLAHPNFGTGEFLNTSRIVRLTIETENSIYEIDVPSWRR